MIRQHISRIISILVIVVFALTIIPFNSNAKGAVELTGQDFADSIDTPGVPTEKGIIYDSEYQSFDLLPNDYIFVEDIDFAGFTICVTHDGEYTLDLNNKTLEGSSLSPLIRFNDGKVTITGNGNVVGGLAASMSLFDCEATIINGKFDKMITSGAAKGETAKIVIEDVNCGGFLIRGEGATATINGGYYRDELNAACTLLDGASIVINKGTFSSAVETLTTQTDLMKDPTTGEWYYGAPPKSVIINGGTFLCTGDIPDYLDDIPKGALVFYDCDNVVLNGGTFNASDNSLGGIVVLTNNSPEDEYNSYLGNGYSYSEPLSIEEVDANKLGYYKVDNRKCYATQKNISVVQAVPQEDVVPADSNSSNADADDGNSKVKPPKTGDYFLSWFFNILGV